MNQQRNTPRIGTEFSDTFTRLLAAPQVEQALQFIKEHQAETLVDQIAITEIPAPTFEEHTRADYYRDRLAKLGLEEVHVDDIGNVIGIRPGVRLKPTLVLSAHLDTVFPAAVDTTVKREDGKLLAPGIADDSRGLTAVLTILKAMNHARIETEGTLMVCATVGEEGLGDLRGVKRLCDQYPQVNGFISIEPGSPSSTVYRAVGSKRFRITYHGPGGHSYGAFGTPSAIHALGRAAAAISDLETPEEPKTTFNIGLIDGGISVNTIAAEAAMVIDVRSTDETELQKTADAIVELARKGAADENDRWDAASIGVEVELVGERPAGEQAPECAIVQAAWGSTEAVGLNPRLQSPGSTDANVPISRGIPAVTLGGGGSSKGVHTLEEAFDPTDAYYGVQRVLLAVIGLTGLAGVTNPLLPSK